MNERIKPIRIETDQLCEYGCGQQANYIVTIRGKKCCSKTWKSCPELIKKSSQSRMGAKRTIEMKKRISESHIGQISNKKGKNYLEVYGKDKAKKIIAKMSKAKKLTIESLKENHPFFCKIEELRKDIKTGEIQGHCKNHNCENSKEKNGWFILTHTQIGERIRCLEHKDGNDGSYFYCSEHCKMTCDLYGKTAEQIIRRDLINAGHIPEKSSPILGLEIWRDEVYKRNEKLYGFNQCEICGSIENMRSHHIYPQKTHPEMALDPDNGLIVCHECHVKKCHPKGTSCSFGELAKLVCEKRYNQKSLEIFNNKNGGK